MKGAHVIIQARINSTRLARKVLLKVLDKTILEYVIERVMKSVFTNKIIVATTTRQEDLEVKKVAEKMEADIYQGPEEDVLDRFYQAAKLYKSEHIVRITADCPLIDPEIIDAAIKYYFNSEADYCSNTLDRTFPDGEDVEVFSFKALSCARKNANLLSEREHVTPYITRNPGRFRLANFKNDADLSAKRWSLDREDDFKLIKVILESLYPANPDFHMKDIAAFLRANPGLEGLNKNVTINEGYLKSLKEDRVFRASGRKN